MKYRILIPIFAVFAVLLTSAGVYQSGFSFVSLDDQGEHPRSPRAKGHGKADGNGQNPPATFDVKGKVLSEEDKKVVPLLKKSAKPEIRTSSGKTMTLEEKRRDALTRKIAALENTPVSESRNQELEKYKKLLESLDNN